MVEQVFVAASARSALVLGQARGVALAAAAAAGLPVFEYGPRAIKLAVAGSGAAGKPEVQRMVCALLALDARARAPTPPTRSPRRSATCAAAALPAGRARAARARRAAAAPGASCVRLAP